jgi:hypothetical protein
MTVTDIEGSRTDIRHRRVRLRSRPFGLRCDLGDKDTLRAAASGSDAVIQIEDSVTGVPSRGSAATPGYRPD